MQRDAAHEMPRRIDADGPTNGLSITSFVSAEAVVQDGDAKCLCDAMEAAGIFNEPVQSG